MRWLTLRRRAQQEQGATAIFVAVVLFVLMGAAAIAVDVAHMFQERGELQNGADAAALAIAEDCSQDGCGTYQGTADGLADANALDSLADVEPVEIDYTAQTVKVDTDTATVSGGGLAHWFAPLLGIDESEISASATALWGGLESGKSIPLAISQCDWLAAGGGTGSPVTLPTGTQMFAFHDGNSPSTCNGTSGLNLPGGFGWLETEGGCETKTLKAGEWAESNPGAAPPSDCSPSDFLNQEVQIPVFKAETGSGANGEFQVWGFATIEITGIRLLMGNSLWTGGDISLCASTSSGTGPGLTGTETTEVGIAAAPGGNGNGNGGGGTTTTTAAVTPTTVPSSPGGPGSDQACIVGEFKKQFVPTGAPGTPGSGVPDLGTTAVRLIA